ncbi:MAG: hypothetical protein LC777_03900, partial [Actinobacteria bacterium]|nr:hypothetical protein [Actinomycetota bacterium]
MTSLTIDPEAALSPGRQAVAATGTFVCTAGESLNTNGRLIQGSRTGTAFTGMMFPLELCTG